ncbi:MAG: OB-fold-containig protein [Pseudomonadota bacterium]
MLEFLLSGDNAAFVAALALMLLIGLAELVGLGSGLVPDADLDADLDGGASLLQWLNVGRLPLLMLLVVLLLVFGLSGLVLQRLADAVIGRPAPWFLAVPLALAAAIPATRASGRALARFLPRDETTAVSRDSLVGRIAVIVTGEAAPGSPAQARTRDIHDQPHYVMVEPDTADETFAEGETVVLVRQAGATFFAVRGAPALRGGRV